MVRLLNGDMTTIAHAWYGHILKGWCSIMVECLLTTQVRCTVRANQVYGAYYYGSVVKAYFPFR